MTNRILIKRSGVANATPESNDLEYGELAINYEDGRVFYKNSEDEIAVLVDTKNIDVPGNVTANSFIGDGSQLTGISASGNSISSGTSNVDIGAAGSNVTVSVAGVSNVMVISVDEITISGDVIGNRFLGNIDGTTGTFTGNVSGETFLGNIDGTTGTFTGNVTGSNINTSGSIDATGNISGGNLSGTNISGTLTTANQPNITELGTLSTLAVTGNISGGNLTTLGAVTGNGRALTSLNASNLDTGTVPSARLSGTYTITVSGSATTAGTVTTAAQPNITSVGTLSSLSVTGNVTANYFIGDGSLLTGIGNYTVAVISGNTAAQTGTLYVLTDTLTLTLPASPAVGAFVAVSNRSNQTNCIIARNGRKIMGDNEDLVINVLNASFELVYIDTNQGWVLL